MIEAILNKIAEFNDRLTINECMIIFAILFESLDVPFAPTIFFCIFIYRKIKGYDD